MTDFDDADLIIEAAYEDMAVKKDLFRRLDAVARTGAILATNTSYLDVEEIARATGRPEDVVGLHFFSPAHVMRLVEVVRHGLASQQTLATALSVVKRLDKVPVVAGVCEGFIGNRIFSSYRRQCEFMVEEGAAPDEVDAALRQSGWAMGPFAVSDLAGLDIAWATRKRLAPTRDPRERYVAVADRICERGMLGRKTGQGWYVYDAQGRRTGLNPAVAEIVLAERERKGIRARPFSQEEIALRALERS